jgi:hypothetical protein
MAQTMTGDKIELELGNDEVATDVEVQDSSEPEKTDQGSFTSESAEPSSNESAAEHRSELEDVSGAVQKRIAKLTARMREAERREQAAVDYAKGLQNQTQTLQQKLANTDYSRLNEAKTRIETQAMTLKAIIRKAREENDIDTETEAQQRLTDLTMEQRQVSNWLEQGQAQAQQAYQPQQAPQPQQQAAPAYDPRAEEWAAQNNWYGRDSVMTYGAWAIHKELENSKEFAVGSEEYYTEMDRRLRDSFPQKFAKQMQTDVSQPRQQRSAPAVAPATRSSGVNSARRTVRLSPSQVAIAKRLGVPLEEYAKYVKE